MPSTITDRLNGVTASLAVKAPVKAATTANITLSAEQTVDGVSCVEGDRVLVKDQDDAAENGIYIVSTGTWRRAPDFDGARDVVTGTLLLVIPGGSTNGSTTWEVTTANPITFGTSDIAFQRALYADLPVPVNPGDDGKVLSASGGAGVWATLASLGAAVLSAANIFTGSPQRIVVQDTSGTWRVTRQSATTNSDGQDIGGFLLAFENDAGEDVNAAQFGGSIGDASDGTEDGIADIRTARAGGPLTNRVRVGDGMYSANATGGDQGAESANFNTIFRAGVAMDPATQAEMETGTDVTVTALVTAGRQHFHPSAAKGWANFGVDGVASASYNVTSITDTGTGDWTVNWGTDFSGAGYGVVTNLVMAANGALITQLLSAAGGSIAVNSINTSASKNETNVNAITIVAFGDHA